jgi:hypothetical protein
MEIYDRCRDRCIEIVGESGDLSCHARGWHELTSGMIQMNKYMTISEISKLRGRKYFDLFELWEVGIWF